MTLELIPVFFYFILAGLSRANEVASGCENCAEHTRFRVRQNENENFFWLMPHAAISPSDRL